jgi:hypothetical protein
MTAIELHAPQPNFTRVVIGDLGLYWSYTTLVAIRFGGEVPVVRRNEWGMTTGRHLNNIDGGSKDAQALRVGEDEFEQAVQARLEKAGL